MNKEQKRQEISALGVHDLRHFARNLGISRPTMKIKEELVESILDVLMGDKKISNPGNRGRKATVKLASVESFDFVLPPALQNVLNERFGGGENSQRNINVLTLRQNIQADFVRYSNKEGFLQVRDGHHFFWDIQKDQLVSVPQKLVDDANLVVGDRIMVQCAECQGAHFGIANQVLTVNFSSNFAKRKFDNFYDDVDTKSKLFVQDDLVEGACLKIFKPLMADALDVLAKTLNQFAQNGFSVVAFGTSVTNQFLATIKSKICCEEAVTFLVDNPSWVLSKVQAIMHNIIVRASAGEKIVLLILDGKTFLDDLVSFCGESVVNRMNAKRLFEGIVGLNKKLVGGGSVTVVIANA